MASPHKLLPEQRRKVAKLYRDHGVAVPELAERFRVGRSTIENAIKEHGIALVGKLRSPHGVSA